MWQFKVVEGRLRGGQANLVSFRNLNPALASRVGPGSLCAESTSDIRAWSCQKRDLCSRKEAAISS